MNITALVSSVRPAAPTDAVALGAERPTAGNSTDQIDLRTLHNTDAGNARRLVAQHGADLLYIADFKSWFIWDGKRFRKDDRLEILERAKSTALAIYQEAADESDADRRQGLAIWARNSEQASRIRAMVDLARSEPGIAATPAELDRDPWLFNVGNGTLDLRTGQLRPHDRGHLITRLVPVAFDIEAQAPTFEKYLGRTFANNENLIAFVRRAAGYSLTGDTSERAVFILYGIGMSGKSVFIKTMRAVLGDYGMRTPTDTFMKKAAGGENRGLARLKGARFVSASESEDGDRFAAALLKDVSGDEPIAARALYQEQFEYHPEYKVWLATNDRPRVSAEDQAIWDRLHLVPFTVRVPDEERDVRLMEKLNAELPGILAWAVRGCREWQESGLGMPEEVRAATEEYRAEMDSLGDFIEERCILGADERVEARALYRAYVASTTTSGGHPLGERNFIKRMVARPEITKIKSSVTVLVGISLVGDRELAGDESESSP